MALSYRDAGVDQDAADRLVHRLGPLARRTHRPEVLAGIGGFAAQVRVPLDRYQEPVLVMGSDGVGTKLRIACETGRFETIGIDLVAMCANDVATSGAEPLSFLDTISAGRLDVTIAESIVKGVAEGCVRAGCALVGGETAELPGLLAPGDWHLDGTCVGVAERSRLLDGSRVKPGDSVIGIASSGLHANGFSLARKVFFDVAGLSLGATLPGLEGTLADELLRPTHVYARLALALCERTEVHAMAHVTGGGLSGNLPRVLPTGTAALLDARRWRIPPVFEAIQRLGLVAPDELARTFNLGIGWCVVTPEPRAAIELSNAAGFEAFEIGRIVARPGEPVAVLEHLA